MRDRRKAICLIAALVSITAGVLVFGWLNSVLVSDAFYHPYVLSAVLELFFIGTPAILLLSSGTERWQLFRKTMRLPDRLLAGLSTLAAVSLTMVSGIVGNIWQIILDAFGLAAADIVLPDPESASQWAVAIITAAIIPAICEEIMFRGLVLEAFGKRFSRNTAILLSAFLFALCHFNLEGFPSLFVIGLLLAAVMYRHGKIWVPVLIHAVYNASSIIINASGADISSAMVFLCMAVFFLSAHYLMQKGEASCS